MITTPFEYVSPTDALGVVAALADVSGEAVVLGGGTMVVPEMTHGVVRPSLVVDTSRAGMSYVRDLDGDLRVGAATTYSDILASAAAATGAPLLYRLSQGVTGGPQIRNQGTVGGSACYANPSSDLPAALVAHGARLRLMSAQRQREVDAADYITGAFATVRSPDEVLHELVIPRLSDTTRVGYMKLKLSESSWPIATAAAVVDGEQVRLALGGVAERPLLLHVDPRPSTGDDRRWRQHVGESVDRALTDPWSDVLADADYRRQVAPVVAVRAVIRADEL